MREYRLFECRPDQFVIEKRTRWGGWCDAQTRFDMLGESYNPVYYGLYAANKAFYDLLEEVKSKQKFKPRAVYSVFVDD